MQAYIRLSHANVSDVEQTSCLSEEHIRNVRCDRHSQYRAYPKGKLKVCFSRQTVRRSHFPNNANCTYTSPIVSRFGSSSTESFSHGL